MNDGVNEAAARRRARPLLSRPFVMVLGCGVVLLAIGLLQSLQALPEVRAAAVELPQGRNTIAEQGSWDEFGRLQAEVRRLRSGLERAMRSDAPLRRLDPLPTPPAGLAALLPLYLEEVARCAQQERMDDAWFAELERMGFPLFHAGVAWLQERDYSRLRDCQEASRVMALLARMTGLDGLVFERPQQGPDEPTSRRFIAAAQAWRRVLERHARSEPEFERLLVATKKRDPEAGPH